MCVADKNKYVPENDADPYLCELSFCCSIGNASGLQRGGGIALLASIQTSEGESCVAILILLPLLFPFV